MAHPTTRYSRIVLTLLFAGASACGGATDGRSGTSAADEVAPIGAVRTDSTAVFRNASTPNMATAANGEVLLSFTEQVDSSQHALRFARWQNGRWDAPRDITRNRQLFVNWADFASVVQIDNGDLVAHWLEREGSGTYSYGIRIARSTDGGANWSTAVTPHLDGLLAEHGFVTLWPTGGDGVGAVWLDGRKSAMKDSARDMMLRSTVLGREGVQVQEFALDSRICDCCQTSSARASSGRVIVYRDRSADEIRDIGIVREVNGTWSTPQIVHADNWHIEGCPVNGPSVAALGDTVVVAWFTGAQDTARVQLARSTDGGASFGAPVRIDDGEPLGRVSVLLDDRGEAVVLWQERTSTEESELRVRRVSGMNARSSAVVVSRTAASRKSGFPRMAMSGDQLVFAYTVVGDSLKVQTATAALRSR